MHRLAPHANEMSDSPDERIRLLACEAVLNRGVDKPRDHSDEEPRNSRANLSGLSPDELSSLAVLLKRALGIAYRFCRAHPALAW